MAAQWTVRIKNADHFKESVVTLRLDQSPKGGETIELTLTLKTGGCRSVTCKVISAIEIGDQRQVHVEVLEMAAANG